MFYSQGLAISGAVFSVVKINLASKVKYLFFASGLVVFFLACIFYILSDRNIDYKNSEYNVKCEPRRDIYTFVFGKIPGDFVEPDTDSEPNNLYAHFHITNDILDVSLKIICQEMFVPKEDAAYFDSIRKRKDFNDIHLLSPNYEILIAKEVYK